jgi:hypothetical protein
MHGTHWKGAHLTALVQRALVAAIFPVLHACAGPASDAASLDNGLADLSAAPVPRTTQFAYPIAGQLLVDRTHAFEWNAVPGVLGYQLQVGTSPGGADVFDSGFITSTSVPVPNLPTAGVLFARVRVIPPGWPTTLDGIAGYPLASYLAFSTAADLSGSAFTYPQPGATLDADTPISWQTSPLARGYRLLIGTSPGGRQLLDTGTIVSSMRVVTGLPAGATLFATLYTHYPGRAIRSQAVWFVVGNPNPTTNGMLVAARALTAAVRGMADMLNQPYRPTPLVSAVVREGDATADCTAYTATLLTQLADANIPLTARGLDVCFNTNTYDCHELVEIYDPDKQRWITLDPTFGMYALNAAGEPATSGDLSTAARAQAFGSLSFVYLTPAGDAYARAYYLDYPLLFLNVYEPGSANLAQPAPLLRPYLEQPAPSAGAVASAYALGCATGAASATANINGTDASYSCTNDFTHVFYAYSVALDAGNPTDASVWQPRRFVF